MTTYAIALLTDRKLLIKIDKPCPLEKTLLPNEIDWRFNLKNFEFMSKLVLHIKWDFEFIKREFFNINFINLHSDVDIIIIELGLQLIRHLTVNKNHHAKIKEFKWRYK